MTSYIDNLNEYRIRSMDLLELNHWAQETKRELEERDREREEQEQEQARKDNIRIRVAKRLNEEFERRDRRDGRRTTRNYYHQSSSTAEEQEEDYDPFWQLKLVTSKF